MPSPSAWADCGHSIGVTGGEPLAFPAEDCDAPLRAYIGNYGAISLEAGTLPAFEVLVRDGRVSADL